MGATDRRQRVAAAEAVSSETGMGLEVPIFPDASCSAGLRRAGPLAQVRVRCCLIGASSPNEAVSRFRGRSPRSGAPRPTEIDLPHMQSTVDREVGAGGIAAFVGR